MDADELRVQARVEREHWWYLGRRRILDDSLRALVRQRGGEPFRSACDVGAGAGGSLQVLQRHAASVLAADVDPIAVRACRDRGHEDVCELSLERAIPSDLAGRFELVIAMDVLEHLDDDVRGARGLAELLLPGGVAFVTVPAFQFLWGLQDEVSHHRRRYRLAEVVERLRAAGFRVQRATYFNTLLFPPIAAARWLMRWRRPRAVCSENEINTPSLNALLSWVFRFEAALLRRGTRFPVGVSVLVIAERAVATGSERSEPEASPRG